MKRIAKFISYHPKIIILIALLLLIPSAVGYINTFVNYDILSYLPSELDSVKGEIEIDESFNSASMSFLVIEDMPEKDIVNLKEKIKNVKNVSDVLWVDDIADISIPKEALPDAVKKIFYSTDGKSTMLLVRYKYQAVTNETMQAVSDIRSLLNKQCFMSGMGVIMKDTCELADTQAPIFIAIAISLALVIMSFCMESWFQPFVLLAALCIAVVYNMGTNIFFGQISYITQCIAAILQLGVTMDYSVFLIDRYEEEKLHFADKRDAMASAIQGAFVSLSGSSLTTIFGFLALCFMDLSLGMDIGLVMAKGVLLGVLTVAIVLPALVLLSDKLIHKYHHRSFIPKFDKLNSFVIKRRKAFTALFFVLIIPAYLIQMNVDVYYSMDKMLPDDIPCIAALNKMKTDFNMATSHFIIVDDNIDASQLISMENEIRATKGVTSMVAYNDFIGSAMPDSMIPDSLKSLAKTDGRQMLLVNTSFVSATDECNKQLDQLESIVKKYDPSGVITGEGAMYKDLIDITDHDFKLTSILSILSIFILIAIIFKSISIPTILVASIELAILINKAVSVLLGSSMSFIAPTVIGCVQLGATVDYAILLTTRFKEELRLGKSAEKAMLDAANASDRSIFQSALVFFGATFGVFLTCDIKIVKEICSMLARGSLISAGIIIFILTPMLLSFRGIINKTTYDFLGKKAEQKKQKTNNGGTVMMKKYGKKAVSVMLCLAMAFSLTSCSKKKDEPKSEKPAQTPVVNQVSYDKKADNFSKNETVYVNMDADGQVTSKIVTDWLHTDKAETYIDDVTDLKNVKNVKNNIEPISNKDGTMRWNMESSDLYYRGTTDKELPVNFSISYYLNGKQTTAKEIAGQAGQVKIVVTITNQSEKTVKINGKDTRIYTPFIVAGGMILQENNFTNINVENGRAIGDGTKEIALMVGAPGLKESLNISDDLLKKLGDFDFSNTYTITADTTKFEISNFVFAVLPLSAIETGIETALPNTISDVRKTLGNVQSIIDKFNSMNATELINSLFSNSDNITELAASVKSVTKLYNDNKALIEVIEKYMTEENLTAIKSFIDNLDDVDLEGVSKLLADPILQKFFKKLPVLSKDMQNVMPILSGLSDDMSKPEVQKAINNLPQTLETIKELKTTLDKNKDLFVTLNNTLDDKTLASLKEIMNSIDSMISEDMIKEYANIAGNADELIARAEEWLKAGKEYKVFTKSNTANTSVMFIYETAGISAPAAPEETEKPETTEENPIKAWFEKVFNNKKE